MLRVHERLREALRVTRDALDRGVGAGHATRDPAIAEDHPELRDTLRNLEQDHSMIAHLLGGLQGAVDRAASPAELERHLDGIAAIMTSHFRYEERQLTSVLDTLEREEDPRTVFGQF